MALVSIYLTSYLTLWFLFRCSDALKLLHQNTLSTTSLDSILLTTTPNSWVKGHAHFINFNQKCFLEGKQLDSSECSTSAHHLISEKMTSQQLRVGVYARTGRKDRGSNGQDHFTLLATPAQISLSLCDGHSLRGFTVAQNACRQLSEGMKNTPFPSNSVNPDNQGFKTNSGDTTTNGKGPSGQYFETLFNKAFAVDASEKMGGSTGTAIVIAPLDRTTFDEAQHLGVFVANLGDSRAVIYNFKSPKTGRFPNVYSHKSMTLQQLIPDEEWRQKVLTRWMTDEQSYGQVREVLHAEAEMGKINYRLAMALELMEAFQQVSLKIFAPTTNQPLIDSITEKKKFMKTKNDVNSILWKIAAERGVTLWVIATYTSLMRGPRTVLRKFAPKENIVDVNPSGGFADAIFKPIQRKAPSIMKAMHLGSSKDCSSLLLLASDGIWDPFDARHSHDSDPMKGTREIGSFFLSKVAELNDINGALQELYFKTIQLGGKDDVTAVAILFPQKCAKSLSSLALDDR